MRGYALIRKCWGPLLVYLLVGTAEGQEQPQRVKLSEVVSSGPFLRHERPAYRNYAFHNFVNYLNHAHPYSDAPQTFYSAFGDHLITGYDLYLWEERTIPGLEFGSFINHDSSYYTSQGRRGAFPITFDHMVMGRDSYGDWGYSAVVGDGLIARLTPLTLSITDFNGARLDVATPYVQFTGMGSRISYDHLDTATLLLGSRMQADAGSFRVGLNWVNLHLYHFLHKSANTGQSLKGVLRLSQPLMDVIVVRFVDDSPADGRGGAVVQEVGLIVNGEVRPDLRPRVIRHRAGGSPQLGRVSTRTGEFTPNYYHRFRGYYYAVPRYYRGRDEIPLYADYLYRFDHEAGVDVSEEANLKGLLTQFQVESAEAILRADGEEQLVYLFDLRKEPFVESVEVEALVGNDYRVEVATLAEVDPRESGWVRRFKSTFYRTVLRSEGNVRDLSNLRRVRFKVGENTAIFAYSADVNFRLAGVEVNGEYARSALYSRFPAHVEGAPIYARSPRFANRGAAYFFNATRWIGRLRVGAEYFSMNPDFTTEMGVYMPFTVDCCAGGRMGGVTKETLYWDLVQDNEDGDRWPDKRFGVTLGTPHDYLDRDADGVFLDQDEDRDGWPDVNRNVNDLPDYLEPFLMYDVEPTDYVYGLDRNNNDEPDKREDDNEPDHPYEPDQRGYHLFGQVGLTQHWSVGLGRYAVEEIAGAGRNRSTYTLLNYHRKGVGRFRRLFFENHLRRVQDNIADEYTVLAELPGRAESDLYYHDFGVPLFTSQLREDLLFYQDSYVNETYLEARLQPWSTLELVQKYRLRLNWQQGGQLYNGVFQRQGRLDYWTVVSRVGYSEHVGKLNLILQFKLLLLRLVDQAADITLRSELTTMPILRIEYPLLGRSTLQGGIQGVGPLPLRFEDRARQRHSFDRRTAFLGVLNRTRYFGYDLHTLIGIRRDAKILDDPFQQRSAAPKGAAPDTRAREGTIRRVSVPIPDTKGFDQWSFFVRALIGFTESSVEYF